MRNTKTVAVASKSIFAEGSMNNLFSLLSNLKEGRWCYMYILSHPVIQDDFVRVAYRIHDDDLYDCSVFQKKLIKKRNNRPLHFAVIS